MADAIDHGERAPDRSAAARWVAEAANAARAAGPPLLFGLRLWASVCLALYVAFWLELDNAYWAGTSAAIVCQPQLGASLRKGWYRMIGTVVGAVAIVVLTACFPQDRGAFMVGLALWGAACTLVATVLRNFAAYAASLAGYTAAIIASDQLGPGGQMGMRSCSRSSASARSGSASCAPGSCSPGRTSVALGSSLPQCSRPCQPKSSMVSPPHWRRQDRRRPTRNSRFGAYSRERSSRSIP